MKRATTSAVDPGTATAHSRIALTGCCASTPKIMEQNPQRLLTRGFATYTDADADALAKSGSTFGSR